MKNLTAIVLMASLVFTMSCEEKEEDLVLPNKNIEHAKGANGDIGDGDHTSAPWD